MLPKRCLGWKSQASLAVTVHKGKPEIPREALGFRSGSGGWEGCLWAGGDCHQVLVGMAAGI